MQFQAYLVKQNSSPLLNVTLIGIVIFLLSIFLWAFEVPDNIALFATVAGILVALIGALLNRGKGLFEVDDQLLSIDEEQITSGASVYPINKIADLFFYYESFYSQSTFGYFFEDSGLIEYGMNNTISFSYNTEKVTLKFYLSEMGQADRFFSLLEYLKDKGVAYSFDRRPEGTSVPLV